MANGNGYTVKEILDEQIIPTLKQLSEDVSELKRTSITVSHLRWFLTSIISIASLIAYIFAH